MDNKAHKWEGEWGGDSARSLCCIRIELYLRTACFDIFHLEFHLIWISRYGCIVFLSPVSTKSWKSGRHFLVNCSMLLAIHGKAKHPISFAHKPCPPAQLPTCPSGHLVTRPPGHPIAFSVSANAISMLFLIIWCCFLFALSSAASNSRALAALTVGIQPDDARGYLVTTWQGQLWIQIQRYRYR